MNKTLLLLILSLTGLYNCTAQSTQIPYFENFENGSNGWSTADNGLGTSWQLGTPTSGFTLGAYSGSKCWDVNLNAGYQNNAVCDLISPVFDFSMVSQAKISFFTHYHTEFLWDYLTVQYTVSNGDSWSFLPFPNLANPDGMTPKWIQSALVVNDLYGNSEVQFRFTFISDGSTTYDGYSIDDFRIETDPLSATELNVEQLFSVYPNPSKGAVQFNFDGVLTTSSILNIYNAEGNLVVQKNANEVINQSTPNLQLSKGVYTVILNTKNQNVARKLVIL